MPFWLISAIFITFWVSLEKKCTGLEEWTSTKNAWAQKGANFETIYTGDFLTNTKGGLTRASTYLGNFNMMLTLDTKRLGWWENGTFFINALNNHGGKKLSSEIVGDTQTVSNIEAPRTIRLYELWYEHKLQKNTLSLLLGLHDLNSEFLVTEYGGVFINSSFGVPKQISGNSRPSIFPLAASAIRIRANFNDQFEFLFGVYDGNPGDPETDEHFPRVDFDLDGGAFLISELDYKKTIFSNLPTSLKAGVWTNTGEFVDVIETDENENPLVHDGNYGGYLILDQTLYREEGKQGLNTFLQIGGVPDSINHVDFYVGGGLTYQGLFPKRDQDIIGLAVAHASLSDKLVNTGSLKAAETTLEATYKAVVCDSFSFQPDVQFIFNSNGDPAIDDAVVAGFRFELIL